MARYLLPLPRLPQVERCTRLTLRRVRFGAGGDGARNSEGLRVVPWRPPILLWRLRDAALVRGREAARRGLRYGRRLRRPGAIRAGGAPNPVNPSGRGIEVLVGGPLGPGGFVR